MKKYFSSAIGFFRLIAFLEGLSLLILLFVAMPMKYMFDKPKMVQTVGGFHGLLFMLFVYLAFRVAIRYEWKFIKTSLIMISSFVPFGTIIADHKVFKGLHQGV